MAPPSPLTLSSSTTEPAGHVITDYGSGKIEVAIRDLRRAITDPIWLIPGSLTSIQISYASRNIDLVHFISLLLEPIRCYTRMQIDASGLFTNMPYETDLIPPYGPGEVAFPDSLTQLTVNWGENLNDLEQFFRWFTIPPHARVSIVMRPDNACEWEPDGATDILPVFCNWQCNAMSPFQTSVFSYVSIALINSEVVLSLGKIDRLADIPYGEPSLEITKSDPYHNCCSETYSRLAEFLTDLHDDGNPVKHIIRYLRLEIGSAVLLRSMVQILRAVPGLVGLHIVFKGVGKMIDHNLEGDDSVALVALSESIIDGCGSLASENHFASRDLLLTRIPCLGNSGNLKEAGTLV